jgi:hypothetical protein
VSYWVESYTDGILKAAVFTNSFPKYLVRDEASLPLPLPGIPETKIKLIV